MMYKLMIADNTLSHNKLVDQITDKLVDGIKEKHLVTLIAEFEPTALKKQHHIDMNQTKLSEDVLRLLDEKNYTCVFNDGFIFPEARQLLELGANMKHYEYKGYPYRKRNGDITDYYQNELNEFILLITNVVNGTQNKLLQKLTINNGSTTILGHIIGTNLDNMLANIISRETESVIKFFSENGLHEICKNNMTKSIRQIISFEKSENLMEYFKPCVYFIDDPQLIVDILTNHIPDV